MDALPSFTLRQAFGRRLNYTARQWRRAVDDQLQPFGLSDATWLPLVYIARGTEPMRQKDLAKVVGIESSTLVRLLDALDDAGLIARQTDGDRRVKTLHLTPRGRQLVEQVQTTTDAIRQRILAGITEAELTTALSVFERVCAALARERAPAAAAP
jgi:MarR family transcriptional regulator for hemolysin